LITRFAKAQGDFLPVEPRELEKSLRSYLADGRSLFPIQEYLAITGLLSDAPERATGQSQKLRVARAALLTNYMLTPWLRHENHLPIARGWLSLCLLALDRGASAWEPAGDSAPRFGGPPRCDRGPDEERGLLSRSDDGVRADARECGRDRASIKASPLATMYPKTNWEASFRKVGELHGVPYDWTKQVEEIRAPTLLIFADADAIRLDHIAAMFYHALGGGRRDAGHDGSLRASAQLAIVPGATHRDLVGNPALGSIVEAFLSQMSAR
jgi:pimeloyl-ACP methyl ester carboxylesterase